MLYEAFLWGLGDKKSGVQVQCWTETGLLDSYTSMTLKDDCGGTLKRLKGKGSLKKIKKKRGTNWFS